MERAREVRAPVRRFSISNWSLMIARSSCFAFGKSSFRPGPCCRGQDGLVSDAVSASTGSEGSFDMSSRLRKKTACVCRLPSIRWCCEERAAEGCDAGRGPANGRNVQLCELRGAGSVGPSAAGDSGDRRRGAGRTVAAIRGALRQGRPPFDPAGEAAPRAVAAGRSTRSARNGS